ncbi:hypothetical protein GCM10023213_34870 [Prosthecobacter algae]|uniref:GYF domain-containing protein n=1 Tax=Prosthecobacter algae TaxID=1144682 RepID=A0ABP9PCT6_9BACT
MTQTAAFSQESQNWFYAHNGQAIGPISFSELQRLKQSGQLGPEVQIVAEGGQDWRPIGDVLASLCISQPAKKSEVSPARKAAGMGCLSLLVILGAIAILCPAPEKETAAVPAIRPADKPETPAQGKDATAPAATSGGLSEAQKEAYRKELLSIYRQLEALRPALAMRKDTNDMEGAAKAGRELKAFRESAMARVKQIQQEAAADFAYSHRAAVFIEGLWLKYLASDGAETPMIRTDKEAIAESLKALETLNAK